SGNPAAVARESATSPARTELHARVRRAPARRGARMKLSETLAAPSWVVLQLVEACNLRCTMCYEWGETGAYHDKPTLASLDLDVALRIVRECLPARPYFELFGGEPLLHPGIWDVISAIRTGGCELAFPTNGTLLEE